MDKQSYEGLNEEQSEAMRNFDRKARSSAAKLGLARRAVKTEASNSRGKNEMERLMTAKYGEFFKLFARLSEESQQVLIEKARNFNLKPDGTEKDFLELMADLNRHALSLAPEDDPSGEVRHKPGWRDELVELEKEMERLQAEKRAKNLLISEKEPVGDEYIN